MGYDAVGALSNNKSRGHKPAVRKEKHTEKNKEKPTSQKNDMPPKVVDASSATASSISVLEYAMPFNYDGKKMTFQTCVKDHLFPLVKFLPQGDDDTNVEYSLDATTVWSAIDLTRNDPFLPTTPKVVFSKRTTPRHLEMLKKLGSVQEIDGETLVQFGLPLVNPKE